MNIRMSFQENIEGLGASLTQKIFQRSRINRGKPAGNDLLLEFFYGFDQPHQLQGLIKIQILVAGEIVGMLGIKFIKIEYVRLAIPPALKNLPAITV